MLDYMRREQGFLTFMNHRAHLRIFAAIRLWLPALRSWARLSRLRRDSVTVSCHPCLSSALSCRVTIVSSVSSAPLPISGSYQWFHRLGSCSLRAQLSMPSTAIFRPPMFSPASCWTRRRPAACCESASRITSRGGTLYLLLICPTLVLPPWECVLYDCDAHAPQPGQPTSSLSQLRPFGLRLVQQEPCATASIQHHGKGPRVRWLSAYAHVATAESVRRWHDSCAGFLSSYVTSFSP
jgi:hypothetical protein